MNVGCVLINALDVRTREADANRFIQQGSAQRQLENIPSAELGEFSEEKNSWRYDEEETGEIKTPHYRQDCMGHLFISAWRIHMWQNIKVHYTGIIPRSKVIVGQIKEVRWRFWEE